MIIGMKKTHVALLNCQAFNIFVSYKKSLDSTQEKILNELAFKTTFHGRKQVWKETDWPQWDISFEPVSTLPGNGLLGLITQTSTQNRHQYKVVKAPATYTLVYQLILCRVYLHWSSKNTNTENRFVSSNILFSGPKNFFPSYHVLVNTKYW